MKYLKCLSLFTIIVVILSFAGTPTKKKQNGDREQSNVMYNFAERVKQGFNMRVWLSNQMALGLEAWDGGAESVPDGIGLEYPAGSLVEHLYGAGPRLGAIIDGGIRVTEGYNGSDARKEFQPEQKHPLRNKFWKTSINAIGEPNLLGYDDDNDGKIDEDELDGNDNDGDWNPLTDDVGSDGLADPYEVSCDGTPYDSLTNPDPADDNRDPAKVDSCHLVDGRMVYKIDPDVYTEQNGLPDHGEPNVDEDYGAISNSDLYCSATDTFLRPIIAGHNPMGAKIIQKSYAWNSAAADAIIFLDYSYINVGRKTWQDTYIGFFADMDIGPVNVSGYYQNNYAAYDSATRTGYIHNPIDRGSTPLGVTLLQTSKPIDSLKFIWQWSVFGTLRPDPGTDDSLIYCWMSSECFADQLIAPNQSLTYLSDTRFFFSFGPFSPVNNRDTLTTAYALVSGYTVDDMLNNARRAHRIYEANGFIMPNISVKDSGGGHSVTVSWNKIDRSPYGLVTSYRVYHGTTPGQYTDSVSISDLSVTYSGLLGDIIQYFAVAAIDEKGNLSALSDEVSTIPAIPKNLRIFGQQITIDIYWSPNGDPDIAGYNLYRRTSSESLFTRMNINLLTDTFYFDTDVWGDKIYYYKISSVDIDDHESQFSQVDSGRLIPPATPQNFVVGPGKNYIYLDWSPNTEEDLAGYNIYCRRENDPGFSKLNDTVYTKTFFIDSVGGSYYIKAVDFTNAESQPSLILDGYFTSMNRGVLIVNQALGASTSFVESTSVFYKRFLQNYKYREIKYPYNIANVFNPSSVYYFGFYSTIFWLYENQNIFIPPPSPYTIPFRLKGYLLGGGKLLLMGRKLTSASYPYWYLFLENIFGVNASLEISPEPNFIGANGMQGFSSVGIDQQKLSFWNDSLGMIERFPTAPTNQVLYTYQSSPLDTAFEGKPVGLRATDPNLKVYYLSFPLYYLDSASAKSLITYVLNDFGEAPLGVRTIDEKIPREFRLYDAYPNPFNPTTKMQFDIAKISNVSLIVYDVLGREVARLVDETKPPGHYGVMWNASLLSSGVYFYRLKTGDFIDVKKMLLVR